ncbi:MAG: hypothetical protein ACOY46_15005 [Bacillota bacterium]
MRLIKPLTVEPGKGPEQNIVIASFLIVIFFTFVALTYTNKQRPVINVPQSSAEERGLNNPFTVTPNGDNLWILDNDKKVLKLYRLTTTNSGSQEIIEVSSMQL